VSLLRYKIDISNLSPEEREKIYEYIGRFSWLEPEITQDLKWCYFYLNESINPQTLNLPDSYYLRRVP